MAETYILPILIVVAGGALLTAVVLAVRTTTHRVVWKALWCPLQQRHVTVGFLADRFRRDRYCDVLACSAFAAPWQVCCDKRCLQFPEAYQAPRADEPDVTPEHMRCDPPVRSARPRPDPYHPRRADDPIEGTRGLHRSVEVLRLEDEMTHLLEQLQGVVRCPTFSYRLEDMRLTVIQLATCWRRYHEAICQLGLESTDAPHLGSQNSGADDFWVEVDGCKALENVQ